MATVQSQTQRVTSSGLLGRAVLALILAFGFWAWVTNQSDPDRERTFDNIPVTIINPPDGLAVTDYSPKAVSISIWGPRSIVSSNAVQAGNFAAVIDLKEIKAGVTQALVHINTSVGNLRKKEANPATIQVTAERSIEKTLPVTVPTQPPAGVKVNSVVASPPEVRASGPESAVNTVTQAVASLDLSNQSTNFAGTVDVSARDASGNPVAGVTLTPARVTVTVDLTDQRNERTVPVSTADFTGTPAAGYQLDSIAANPAQVTLVGDPQQLRNIPNVSTEPISIDGLNQTTTVSARLQTGKLPPGVTIKDNVIQVQVTVNIVEITSTAKFQVPIQAINLRTGLQATLSQREATITLRGTRTQLDQVGTSIAALVNLGNLTTPGGPTTVNVDVQVPTSIGVKVAQVDPPSVQVTVTAPATPTPVPTATATPRPTATPTIAPTPTP